MKSIRYFLTVVLLIFSSQSSALFMPTDFQVNTSADATSNDGGC